MSNKSSTEIWRDLCYRVYPGMMERSRDTTTSTPKSWRKHYFVLREAEAKRLEEIGSRIRSQRLEAEGRKKEREVKMTDRLPPPKRAKTWGTATQPKTLFQKTRSEASKMQKNMYHARIIPPMPKAKDYGPPKASVSLSTTPLLPPPVEGYANRVTVNIVKRPVMTSTTTPKKSAAVDKPRPTITVTSSPHTRPEDRVDHSQPTHHIPVPSTPTHSGSLPMKSPSTFKKDPMATLFVPKHRAYSQRTR
ncbi:hypothetical protein VNI00_003112 [Paramarasmius palmivorus]|uniref:Uncharacterized protein n=1 Tax=Paramarasmius palmivorus TaxID=297713 RepID=A0AAW0DSD7_9AGAR